MILILSTLGVFALSITVSVVFNLIVNAVMNRKERKAYQLNYNEKLVCIRPVIISSVPLREGDKIYVFGYDGQSDIPVNKEMAYDKPYTIRYIDDEYNPTVMTVCCSGLEAIDLLKLMRNYDVKVEKAALDAAA